MQDVEPKSRQFSSKGHTLNPYLLAKFESLPQRLCPFLCSFLERTIQLLLFTSILLREGNLRIFKGLEILNKADWGIVSDRNGLFKLNMAF